MVVGEKEAVSLNPLSLHLNGKYRVPESSCRPRHHKTSGGESLQLGDAAGFVHGRHAEDVGREKGDLTSWNPKETLTLPG